MKKLLKKRKMIKHHRNWIVVFGKILERSESPYVIGHVAKLMERHERTIHKIKKL